MSVLYVVIYKKTLFMQRQHPRGRSTTRNQPKGPRSNSTASTKTEHSEHKHPNDQQNRGRSSSRHSNKSRNSHLGNNTKKDDPSPEELARREFHTNQQALINEVISQMTEKEILTMLNNIHTNGMLDPEKSAQAVKEYEEIGRKITTERDDARLTVAYKDMTSTQKKNYDVCWKTKMATAMADFRTKYHLPPALPRSLVEKIVRENINEIAVKHMLEQSKANDGSMHNEINAYIRDKIKNHVDELKKHNSKPMLYKAGSQASAPTNAGQGSGDSNGGQEDSSDSLVGMGQEQKDMETDSIPTGFAFEPTLWPTEAYTRGQSLRYL
jgi:hypothetical protein